VTIIRKNAGNGAENYATVSAEWSLRSQVEALEKWLTEHRGELDPSCEWIADIGFTPQSNALGGGPPLTRDLMRMCLDANMEIYLSEYSVATDDSQEEEYHAAWRGILGACLGWSSARVLRWAKRYQKYFDNPGGSTFFEDHPARQAAAAVIRAKLRRTVRGTDFVVLRSAVEAAIQGGRYDRDYTNPTEAQAAAERVDAVLRKFIDEPLR
jgi:hypothetical protein